MDLEGIIRKATIPEDDEEEEDNVDEAAGGGGGSLFEADGFDFDSDGSEGSSPPTSSRATSSAQGSQPASRAGLRRK